MSELKLTKEELEKLAKQQLKHRERMRKAQVKRRAKLKDQGKVQVSFMVSATKAEKIKAAVKLMEKSEAFAICNRNQESKKWYIVYESDVENKNTNGAKS